MRLWSILLPAGQDGLLPVGWKPPATHRLEARCYSHMTSPVHDEPVEAFDNFFVRNAA